MIRRPARRTRIVRKPKPSPIRTALASDTLPQAIARGRQLFTGAEFERLLEALHTDPLHIEAWQAHCWELAMYGVLLREKARSTDPRLE